MGNRDGHTRPENNQSAKMKIQQNMTLHDSGNVMRRVVKIIQRPPGKLA